MTDTNKEKNFNNLISKCIRASEININKNRQTANFNFIKRTYLELEHLHDKEIKELSVRLKDENNTLVECEFHNKELQAEIEKLKNNNHKDRQPIKSTQY
jgi:hypothetical protein